MPGLKIGGKWGIYLGSPRSRNAGGIRAGTQVPVGVIMATLVSPQGMYREVFNGFFRIPGVSHVFWI